MTAGLGESLIEAAFDVCTTLDAVGATAVLTGGSAATFYAPVAYQSVDIDFVITVNAPSGQGAQALEAAGYELDPKRRLYQHSLQPFPIEFLAGPLGIGDDLIKTWSTVRRGERVLHVLTATDSVRDRLAAYLFWKDFSGLDQALAVARAQRELVDLAAVEAWCLREGHPQRFRDFRAELSRAT